MKPTSLKALATIVAGVALFAGGRSLLAQTAPVGNSVAVSKHNLNVAFSASIVNTNYGTNQVCLPCHTPHQMPAQNVAQNIDHLWNHTLNQAAYTLYGNSTTSYLATIDPTSRKCLGCHDGTIAVDSYGPNPGTTQTGPMPTGFVVGANNDLSHDHPIDVLYNNSSRYGTVTSSNTSGSFVYTSPWSTTSINDPATFTNSGYLSAKWGNGVATSYTKTALSAISFYSPSGSTTTLKSVTDANPNGGTTTNGATVGAGTNNGNGTYTHSVTVAAKYVYCRSCHDPHNNLYNFLRVPNDNSQVCLTCHNK
jgi:predicted CXXCH cytochrome family protein